MSAKFIKEYSAVYAYLSHCLSGHTGSCKADTCVEFGKGFRAAFEKLPKPPPSRKGKQQ